MEEDYKNRGDECPQLLDLIPHEREWMTVHDAGGELSGLHASQEKSLELRLGLPGREQEESSVLSLGFFPKASKTTTISNPCAGTGGALFEAAESKAEGTSSPERQKHQNGFLKLQSRGGLGMELSHVDQQQRMEEEEEEEEEAHAAPGSEAGPGTSSLTRLSRMRSTLISRKSRTTSVPVVGWPPICSFRKNLASSSVMPSVESENGNTEMEVKLDDSEKKVLLVKINMDGFPIGRKVDLNAHDNYEKLSLAVEELFLGLLTGQNDNSSNGTQKNEEAKQAFTGLLDGCGEYTLVYEDNEGDRMLVGNVPWNMFISKVKRLRVLKSSDISAIHLGAACRKRTAAEC